MVYEIKPGWFFYPRNRKIINSERAIDVPNSGKSDSDKKLTVPSFDKSYPTSLSVNITDECPLKCSYCFYQDDTERKPSLSIKQIDTIGKYLLKNGIFYKMIGEKKTLYVTLSGGGEPTSRMDLLKYLVTTYKSLAKKHDLNIVFTLITNGCFGQEACEFLIEEIDFLQISFDVLEMAQNRNRPYRNGMDSYNTVMKTLERLDKAQKSFSVRTTVQTDEYCYLDKMADMLFSRFSKLSGWHIEPLFYEGRAKNKASCIEEKVEKEYLDNYYDLEKKFMVKYPTKRLYCSRFDSSIKNGIGCYCILNQCIFISASGDMSPCSYRLNGTRYLTGKVYDDHIEKYDISKAVRDDFLNVSEECSNCIAYAFCAGGCPREMMRTGTDFVKSTSKVTCSIIKEYWKRTLNELVDNGKTARLVLLESEDDYLQQSGKEYDIVAR